MRRYFWLFISFIALVFIQCSSEKRENQPISGETLFQTIPSSTSTISFNNSIVEDEDYHHLNWEAVYNGAGVAVGDFNNDGLDDIFFAGNQVNDALYLNEGSFKFKDISESSGITKKPGWSSGVTVVDINGDGWYDIYVSRMNCEKDGVQDHKRKNLLWINQKDNTFKEAAAEYGLDDMGNSTQAAFLDYDQDGDLDVYIINQPSNNYAQKYDYINSGTVPYVHSDKLYRNDNGTFNDVSKEAGIEEYGFSLGIAVSDINRDGFFDIYVANDFDQADRLFINMGDGTFQDQIQRYTKHISYSSMGIDIADINNDSYVDIAVLDMQASDHVRSKTNMPSMNPKLFWTNVVRGQHYQYMTNMLQLNNGSGFFSEISQLAGIASTDWSWSILLADFDQDMLKDIYVTNGINKDIRNNDYNKLIEQQKVNSKTDLLKLAKKTPVQRVQNLIYKNQSNSLVYQNKNDQWGANFNGYSYGAAYADFDNDGDLDLVVNNNNDKASIFKNTSNKSYLQIAPVKDGSLVEQCKLFIYTKDGMQYFENYASRGYQSSVVPKFYIGLGTQSEVDSFKLIFPTGQVYVQRAVKANQSLVIDYDKVDLKAYQQPKANRVAFKDISGEKGIDYRHKENKYDDFAKETLLPHMQSKNGPFIVQGDYNGDKLNDIFIGGSHGNPGILYTHKGDHYTIDNQSFLEQDKAYEDQGAVFFDVDNDGDNDLFVVSGGSEKENGDDLYKDRLYINNKGQFEPSGWDIPGNNNGSIVLAFDANNDNKMDLFVAGRSIPQQYPHPASCKVLINTSNGFEDQTKQYLPEDKLGMIYDATFADLNGDNNPELILVGEFMAPKVLSLKNNMFQDVSKEYIPETMDGWWYDVIVQDIDGDNNPEIFLGNIGMNNKYHPNREHPLKIYGNDFDKNNTPDIVLSKTTDKYGEVPVRGRECSSEQMPFIKNKFKDFDGFAHASLKDIYGKSLEGALKLQANNFYSGYLTKKNGTYSFIPYADEAQISAVRDQALFDFDKDGDLDVILIGNMYDTEVETTRHDSSIGKVLRNDNGTFTPMDFMHSGWYTPGNARQMIQVELDGNPFFLVTNNGFIVQTIQHQ